MTQTTSVLLPVEILDACYMAADKLGDVATVTGFYVLAWLHAANAHSDGFIGADWVAECGFAPKPFRYAKAFVAAKLWDEAPDGWRIKAFTLVNPTASEEAKAAKIREQARLRQQRQRDRLFTDERDIVTAPERDIVTKREGIVRTYVDPTNSEYVGSDPIPEISSRCHGARLTGLEVFGAWRQHRGPLPPFTALSPNRKKQARSLAKQLNQHAAATGVDPFDLLISIIKTIGLNPFMCGKNDTGWKADIDYLLKPDTWLKAVEGKLDPRRGPRTADAARKTVRDANVEHAASGGIYIPGDEEAH